MAVGKHQDDQRPIVAQGDELDMPDLSLVLRGQNEGGALCHAGQGGADAIQHAANTRRVSAHRLVYFLAVLHVQIADLQQAVHEHPQPHLRWHAPGAGMGTVQQAKILQILHHIAHGCCAHLLVQGTCQRTAANRVAIFQIGLNNRAKHIPRAVIQVLEDIGRVAHRPIFVVIRQVLQGITSRPVPRH